MSCEDNVCGTGGWTGPKPGDPDNALTLRANSVYGGINVSWSFPTVNPQAVAHTILYRGTNNVFEQAVEQARVGGNIYFDALNPTADTEYWYWIRVRTVNGTLNDAIGPVSAIARPRGEQTLESLTGLIDHGVLAQSLKESIAGINLQGQQLLAEIQNRINSNEALAAAIALVQSGAEQAMTFVQQEITQRTEGDSAIVTMVNNLAAANENNLAVILQQLQAVVTSDSAQASQISTLFVQTGANQAAIQNEAQVRSTNDSAMASQISTLTSRVGSAEATIRDEQTVRANADTALASRTTGVESSLYGNVATGQIGLSTKVTALDGKVTSIGALYTAKVQVNDLIGGFGVYNDGRTVEAGFDVDRFWVGRTGPDKVKPFIIDSGIVYIDKARIRTADIDTLKIAGNAVTIPVFTSGYGGATFITPGSKKNIANFTVVYPYDTDVAILANWQSMDPRSHAGECSITVEANGQQVLFWNDSVPNGISSSHSAGSKTRLSAGTYTFSVYVGNTWSFGDWDLARWSVLVLGVMR
jgi:hypothetical protein